MSLVVLRRLIALTALVLLSGCASHPLPLQPQCVASAEARLSGQFTLEIQHERASHQLLIVSEWQDGSLQLLGFNTVGAEMFQGVLAQGRVQARTARLYRGPQAEHLLWGLLAHQLRDDLQECLVDADLRIQQQAPVVVMRQNQRIFSSRSPGSFVLPQQGISVDVQRLQ